MAKYPLTERQKDLLRVLAPSLRSGELSTEWIVVRSSAGTELLPADQGRSPSEFSGWKEIKQSDIEKLAELGFIRFSRTSGGGSQVYTVDEYAFLEAVEHDFGEAALTSEVTMSPLLVDMSKNSVLGSPQSDSQYECDVFVIMPFAEEFTPAYTDHLKPTVENLGLAIKRGDDFFSKRSIMSDVWSAMFNADLIIADCTGRNPNVFYELGLAHALDKPVIMITQSIDDIPFDIRHLRVIVYEFTPRGMKKLEDDLIDAITKLTGSEINSADLKIIEALYGVANSWVNVTDVLQSKVKNNRIHIKVGNDEFGGDPEPGVIKVLQVIYSYNGQRKRIEVIEDNTLELPV